MVPGRSGFQSSSELLDAYATSCKLAGQLWYLSENLIFLSLSGPEEDFTTNGPSETINRKMSKPPIKIIEVESAMVQQKTLVDPMTKRNKNVLEMLVMSIGFLTEDHDTQNGRNDFKTAETI